MTPQILSRTLLRELDTLRDEIRSYPDERDLWTVPPGVRNSAGNLALHLAGNLRHFVGGVLGGSGYVRDREAEFRRRDVPREEVLALVEAAREEVESALARLDPAGLDAEYPLEIVGRRPRTGDFLLHLGAHLAYHLGQIDYHRRIVTGREGEVRAVAVGALAADG